ncbi:28S ribosomal protein S28, mitochondrial-like [Hyalella azteca]|uniref:28S ribosomal protein S28, mitochondrial-like n=1 Tax=Hyalella azteca TaxID=294128 RepID=A0A8B7N8T0_HYAAZ|nr:28S ribosomal protein S28, mitochondrial-like [Hyalella azteca]
MLSDRFFVSCRALATCARLHALPKEATTFKEVKIIRKEPAKETPPPPKTFLSLLRNSKFIELGDPRGKLVEGRVMQVVGDDLYIDWGGKFLAVCQRPIKNQEKFIRGAVVRIRLLDAELSSRFLGSTIDLTLLEADAKLLGLVSSPLGRSSKH